MPRVLRTSYKDAKKKHLIREFILQRFEFEKIVGLAGPDIEEYLDYLHKKGAKEFEIYEHNSEILAIQNAKLQDIPFDNVKVINNDILCADSNTPKTFYDLDFCDSVKYLQEHIAKFTDNFIMTFSTRIGIDYTIKTFFEAKKEIIKYAQEIHDEFPYTIFTTESGNDYLFIRYKDTAPMCCFAKINAI